MAYWLVSPNSHFLPLPLSLPSFSPLSPPSLSFHSSLAMNRDSLVSLFPVIRGFGFQPACILRPGGFGKTSRLFQSNKELRVRVIQKSRASKRASCTQLLWWITKTKRNIKRKGERKNKWDLLVEWKPAPGAKKKSSLVLQQSGLDVIFFMLLLSLVALLSLFSHD